jgi:hypothetical protein
VEFGEIYTQNGQFKINEEDGMQGTCYREWRPTGRRREEHKVVE